MENNFNELIDSFSENRVGITNDFLTSALAGNLRNNLIDKYNSDLLLSAGTGNRSSVVQDQSYRSDKIYWLDKSYNDPFENEFFTLIDTFIGHLNDTCYTGITDYEFHYTLYETGSFYKKHLDQFRNDSSRKYSMVMYLNEGWQDSDGGELCIHHTDQRIQNISPQNGRSVFFQSDELAHEVLPTRKPRMSITGWLMRRSSTF
ncbi:2OG-Fe(II) oxygenase [Pedobacter sp. GR22-6]|uniref:2OG-Fe(II) oxygenase n=1 Tax=Pedobacter sp. GR22-6 TaxID=3127957 RepID=UPI00307EC238